MKEKYMKLKLVHKVPGTPPTAEDVRRAVEEKLREQPSFRNLPPGEQTALIEWSRKAFFIGEPIPIRTNVNERDSAVPACDHEWVVFSTALGEGCLMLQCVKCHAMGSIDDPSKDEWAAAFSAPSCPYRWSDPTRVRIRYQQGPRFVMRREPGKSCGCPRECTTPGEYERVPGEITTPQRALTQDEKSELEDLASVVAESNLCSQVFPLFVRSFEHDTGAQHSAAVHDIVNRVERTNDKGLHFGPSVVARVLRDYATSSAEAHDL